MNGNAWSAGSGEPSAWLRLPDDLPGAPAWGRFRRPRGILRAERLADVLPVLAEIERSVRSGLWAVGFAAYEAAPAFDPAFSTHPAMPGLPLLWFGLYDAPEAAAAPEAPGPEFVPPAEWDSSLTEAEYARAIAGIKDRIAAGETYQVNFTLRLRAPWRGEGLPLFQALCRAQPSPFAAFFDLGAGGRQLVSASPELFFDLMPDGIVTCRPMKGTAPRGLTAAADRELAAGLQASEKNRAENVMIVDMIRNDLGRIAVPGSVAVPRLFDIERHPTLHQLTSTVTARTRASLPELFAALFPCASITGAPKVRTMGIIREVENAPRGAYTGCIGFVAPGGRARFSVAIRTLDLDRSAGRLEYGTGGGVVWDSTAAGEFAECRTKALILTAARPEFELLETLLWTPARGFVLLGRHVRRLADSAEYFGFRCDPAAVRAAAERAAVSFSREPQRVRWLLDAAGRFRCEAAPFPRERPRRRWRVALADRSVDRNDPFLYHKTTHRQVYAAARAAHPGADDVILWNAAGELTEGTITNLVIRRGGRLLTPPVTSGLLAGTLRDELVARGRIREAVLTRADLAAAEGVWLVNSVRGWIPVELPPF